MRPRLADDHISASTNRLIAYLLIIYYIEEIRYKGKVSIRLLLSPYIMDYERLDTIKRWRTNVF